jgi:hypothetical protein
MINADYGGTNIYEPMKSAINLKLTDKDMQKRIFLLTDGAVGQPEEIVKLIDSNCNSAMCKVFTFGIGNGCSEYLVTKAAEAGKGDYCLVTDSKMSELRSKVVHALRKASEPSLEGCKFNFGVDGN